VCSSGPTVNVDNWPFPTTLAGTETNENQRFKKEPTKMRTMPKWQSFTFSSSQPLYFCNQLFYICYFISIHFDLTWHRTQCELSLPSFIPRKEASSSMIHTNSTTATTAIASIIVSIFTIISFLFHHGLLLF